MIQVTIPVQPVTKKNSQQIITNPKTGRPFLIPSKQFREFEKICKPYLKSVKDTVGLINYPINVKCIFYVSKRLKYDLTNLLEAIDDVMTVSGLILDDNRDIIAGHDGSRVYYDKFNPRIEIAIEECADYAQWNNTKDEQKGLF
jgi:Holliday junction resolvase RusA-like endonuclease